MVCDSSHTTARGKGAGHASPGSSEFSDVSTSPGGGEPFRPTGSSGPDPNPTRHIFSVDVGIRSGMALLGPHGRLLWARSRNFGSRARLRKGVHTIVRELPALELVVLEGGGDLARLWEHEAVRRGIEAWRVSAEDWRTELLPPRMRGNAATAKQSAVIVAQKYAGQCGLHLATAFNDDAAEAALCGLWAAIRLGWAEADGLRIPF